MRHVAHHIILWIVALSILNTSIDIAEVTPVHHAAGIASSAYDQYDEIESIVELVVSETTDNEQQFPDSNSNDEQTVLKKSFAFDGSLPVRRTGILDPAPSSRYMLPVVITADEDLSKGFTTITTPPPDFI